MSLAVFVYAAFAVISGIAAVFTYRRAAAFHKARDLVNANDQYGAALALLILAMVLFAFAMH